MASFKKKWGLQKKLVVALLLVGLFPLGIALVTSYLSQRTILTQTMGTAFQGLAKETSNKLGLWIEDLVARTDPLTSHPILKEALLKANASYSTSSDPDRELKQLEERWVRRNFDARNRLLQSQASQILRVTASQVEDRYAQLLLVDREGGLVAAAVAPSHVRFRDENWWQASYNQGHGEIYIGNIDWDAEVGRYTLPLSVPVRVDGETVGVINVIHKVDKLFKSVTNVHIGQSDHTMLTNTKGDLLFCPIFLIKNHSLNKDLIELVSAPEPGWVISRIDVHYPGREAINGFSPVQFNIAGLSQKSLGGQSWYIFTSQNPNETYGPLTTLLGWMALSAAISLAILVGFSLLMSRRIVRPVMWLLTASQEMTHRIKGLPPSTARESVEQGTSLPSVKNQEHLPILNITTGDEIEDLAESFFEMNQVLTQTRQQLAVTTKRLEDMAVTDELTGLYNRRFFWEELKDEFARTLRFRLDLSCLMIDLDLFKEVNDQYGHHAGDQALKDISQLLKENCREPDTLARFGGEEFIAILPQTDLKGALVQAERLRHEVEHHLFMIDSVQAIKLTISVGVAAYPDRRIREVEDLVRIADEGLYSSKQHGRNRIIKG
jgi:diguanylate cyclase (GGDEF)-like protein